MDDLNLDGWIPGRLFRDDAAPETSVVEWLHCDLPRFDEPFLDDSFALLTRRPANVLFRRRTTLAELEAWAGTSPGITPTGFVFHVSRCGSTLLGRLLGKLDRALTLSEPGPVDGVIRLPGLTFERRVILLRAMVSALGQVRTPGQDRLFVKFDAWNTLQLPLIRAAFPDTPWVFLHRDPVEVLVSALGQRGVHTVPGLLPPAVFGLTAADAGDPEAYAAKVLGAIYTAGVEHHDPARGLILDYADLPGAAWTRAAPHFGIAPTSDEIARLEAASTRDAKRSGADFTPDGVAKRRAATPEVRALADRWMRPAHDQLQALRRKAGLSPRTPRSG